MMDYADVVIVGAGAAGLMAGIWAARTVHNRRVLLLDGARKIGAKILVAGGGRCNVTHDEVSETAYAGSSPYAIRKVLRRFDVPQTTAFFRELGVELKREPTGKLFPVTDDAHTVLDALLRAVDAAGAVLRHPYRVERIERAGDGFIVSGAWGSISAGRVILATGGRSLPKSGSDGAGYALAAGLGHTITPRVFPALVPLLLPDGHFIRLLSGISTPVTLEVRGGTGKRLIAFTDSLLCTHFGISGPAALDVSRYYSAARADDAEVGLFVNWLPGRTTEQVDADLLALGKTTILRAFDALPERLLRSLCAQAGIDPAAPAASLTRTARRALAQTLTALPLPIVGDRGFMYAEVTAGGVPLAELRLDTLESRLCPKLHIIGELCDVDGRIGGYNFQWAWASGYVAGVSVGKA